jgi:hypothetical protein
MEPWEVEIHRRSLEMAPAGTKALLSREEALALIADLRDALDRLKRLRAALEAALDEAGRRP